MMTRLRELQPTSPGRAERAIVLLINVHSLQYVIEIKKHTVICVSSRSIQICNQFSLIFIRYKDKG